MYAHKAIDDSIRMLHFIKGKTDIVYYNSVVEAIDILKKCQKFHLPSYVSLYKVTAKVTVDRFFKEETDHFRLPYPECWFDFTIEDRCFKNQAPNLHNSYAENIYRRGFLLKEYNYKDRGITFIHVRTFYYRPKTRTGLPWKWEMNPLELMIIVGLPPTFTSQTFWPDQIALITDRPKTEIEEHIIKSDCNVIPFISKKWPGERQEEINSLYATNMNTDMRALYGALLLLNTKNIHCVTNKVSKKLKKKQRKHRKTAKFDYKTLIISFNDGSIITLDDKKDSNIFDAKGIHWAMGHWKHYGIKGRKGLLFGQHSGRWFWPAIVKGKAKHRAIRKDYVVKGGEQP